MVLQLGDVARRSHEPGLTRFQSPVYSHCETENDVCAHEKAGRSGLDDQGFCPVRLCSRQEISLLLAVGQKNQDASSDMPLQFFRSVHLPARHRGRPD